MPRPKSALHSVMFSEPKSITAQKGYKRDPEKVRLTKRRNDGEDAMFMKKFNQDFDAMFGVE